jgi:uncharacterized protein with von Willebrand factor type A (vWA) domain
MRTLSHTRRGAHAVLVRRIDKHSPFATSVTEVIYYVFSDTKHIDVQSCKETANANAKASTRQSHHHIANAWTNTTQAILHPVILSAQVAVPLQ